MLSCVLEPNVITDITCCRVVDSRHVLCYAQIQAMSFAGRSDCSEVWERSVDLSTWSSNAAEGVSTIEVTCIRSMPCQHRPLGPCSVLFLVTRANHTHPLPFKHTILSPHARTSSSSSFWNDDIHVLQQCRRLRFTDKR